jgi:DNA polymerase-3 subunit delta'
MTTALDDSTAHQPRARVVLTAALSSGPTHAYLFRGPRGSGKRAAARAFAAEILAGAAENAEDARRRALLDPSPHPDLVWLAPSGAQHLVEEVRERVIRGASYRPFEGGKRVFVVEAADAMRDESQNALLKTLEEPPAFVHLILITSEPATLLETVASRCQPVEFAPLPLEAIEAALEGGPPEEMAAAARLSAGSADVARFLLSERGRSLRAQSLALARAALGASAPDPAAPAPAPSESAAPAPAPSDPTAPASPASTGAEHPHAPWQALLSGAESAGAYAETLAREALDEQTAAGIKRSAREIVDEAKRVGRRRRTAVLDLGLGLCTAWFRDLAATASGAADVTFNRDRLAELEAQASGLDAGSARRAAELVQDTRRRLDLNVSEELALEALYFRLERVLARAS